MFKADYEDHPPPRNNANGSPVCYLDFDGVLHPAEVYATKRGIKLRSPGHNLFEGVPILEEILAPYPAVKIVLSTTWVVVKGFSYAKDQLGSELAARVIGATYHRRVMDRYAFLQNSRGQQIASDVARRGARAWIALDDDDEGWPPGIRDHLVLCPGSLGILDKNVQNKLNAQLLSMHSSSSGPSSSFSVR